MRRGEKDPSDLNRPDGNGLKANYENKDWLHEKYVKDGLTQKEIADIVGCSQHTISRWIRKHNIDTKHKSDYQKHPCIRMNDKGYYVARSQSDGYDDRFYIHRLVAVAEYGFANVRDKDVHHENGITWDNRPKNLEPIEPNEHSKHHRIKELQNGKNLEERFN
jgi:transposase